MKKNNPYDLRYASKEFYWGKKPSAMCDRVMEIISPATGSVMKLIDLGCGEGRNAVYFAKHGFAVTGVDISLPGLRKMTEYAREIGVDINVIEADIIDYQVDDTYDVVFSTGTLHYLPPEVREKRFNNYKGSTSPDGINALNVFVEKPFIPRAPDVEETAHLFKSGELLSYYWDWEILFSTEEVFDCMSSGVPHRHAVNRMIARKIS